MVMSAGIIEVTSFKYDFKDIKGSVHPVEKEDRDFCAVLKIVHNHPGDIFLEGLDNKVYKKEVEYPGCIYFYISHTEKSVIIKPEDVDGDSFKPYKFPFPENLKRKNVYLLEMATFIKPIDEIQVKISTIPQDAMVWINEVKRNGRTPMQFFHKAGNFPIHIEREQYFDFDTRENFTDPERIYELEYKLKSRFGILNINTNEGATVYVNGQLETKRDDIHLDPGKFTVHVEKEYFKTLDVEREIETGDVYPLDIPLVPINGYVTVEPEPSDAKILLIHEHGYTTENIGVLYKGEQLIGNYIMEVSREGYFTKRDSFSLSENDYLKFSPKLKSASIYFTLEIPEKYKNELEVKAYKMSKRKREMEIALERDGDRFVTGEYGNFLVTVCHYDQEVFTKKIEITKEHLPYFDLNYRKYINPVEKCRLYVDGDYVETGLTTFMVTESKSAVAKVKIPKFLDLKHKVDFSDAESDYTLKLGRDYYKWGFGIGLVPDPAKKFLGIKLPIIYSSNYYKMTGIEVNAVIAGNTKDLDGSGTFTGIAVGGLAATAGRDLSFFSIGGLWSYAGRDLNGFSSASLLTTSMRNINGIAIAGLVVEAKNSLNGLALSPGVVSCKHNLNGIAIGGLIIGANDSFNGIGISGLAKTSHDCSGLTLSTINISKGKMSGIQLGVINYAEKLSGIQIGAINIVYDGKGGAVPVMPGINIYF